MNPAESRYGKLTHACPVRARVCVSMTDEEATIAFWEAFAEAGDPDKIPGDSLITIGKTRDDAHDLYQFAYQFFAPIKTAAASSN